MAKKWSDVAASAAFQALSFEEQEEARRQYFEQVIAPRVPEQDVSIALAQFLSDTELKRAPSLDTQPIDYSDAATAMMGTPMSAPPPPLAPAAKPKPAPYKNRLEALDDAVNLVEEGADFKRVAQSFTQIGIGEGDIIAHGIGRKSPMFQDPGLSRRQIDDYVKPELKPMPQPTAEAKPFEPTALQEIGNTLRRGQLSAAQGVDNLAFSAGMFDTGTMAERMRERQRQVGAAAPSGDVAAGLERLQEANETGDYGRVAGELIRPENWKALAALVAESAVASSPAILTTVAGTVLAGPVGGAAAAGLTSLSMEYGAAIGEELQKRKINMSDAVAVRRVLEDDQFLQGARERGLKRGIPVAAFDALSAGFAGRFLRTVQKAADAGTIAGRAVPGAFATATVKEAGLQVGSGVAGEGLAQIATGENKPLDVFIEGLAELPGGLAEVAGNLRSARGMTPEARIADAIQSNVDATRFAGTDEAARAAMSPYSNADTNLRGGIVGGTINFTPPDSITAQAGLAPIVVPTAPGSAGGVDVGLPNVLGGLAGGSGVAGGSDPLAGLGGAGRDAAVPGTGGVNAAGALAGDGGAALLGAGATQLGPSLSAGRGERATDADLLARAEQAAGLTPAPASAGAPAKIWAGRAGDGYMQPQDAQQALPGLQRKYPDLAWDLRQDADGKFFWAGTTKGANLETTATPTAGAQGQEVTAAGALAGQGQAAALPAGTAAGGAAAATQLPGLEAAGLRVAPTAPISEIKKLNTALSSEIGVTVSPVNVSDMSDQQKLASAVARLMGKTLTVVRQETGTNLVPNGMINRLGGKHIYVAEDTEDAPLFVAVHEAYHGLPEDKRQVLNKALLETFRAENKQAFLDEFGYDPAKFDEEAPAMIAQVVSKREDFWQDLRTKMGNKEFGEVAKVILSKLSEIVTGARAQYGDEFVKKYITDIEKARDLLSTAYADAMKAQGLQPDVEVSGGVMASNRAADVNKLGMYSELARKLEAGPNQAPVDQWKAYIKGLPQKGVKPDEIEWSGVEDFLELKRAAGQKVTKAEVAEYLKQGGVQVEETVLGGAGALPAELQSYFENSTTPVPSTAEGWLAESERAERMAQRFQQSGRTPQANAAFARAEQMQEMAERMETDSGRQFSATKYSKYTLPGGENYREVLLTLPENNPSVSTAGWTATLLRPKSPVTAKPEFEVRDQEGEVVSVVRTADDSQRAINLAASQLYQKKKAAANYKSTHWDQPNVLAHIRVNDRTDADGKRVLFVEELQSDWGQEGKKKGFKGKTQEDAKRFFGISDADWNKASEEDREAYRLEMLDANGRDIIPAAPFVTKTEGWLNLALKRVMVMAAEGGYDRVAFTTGEQNAERFSLDKQIDSVSWRPAGPDRATITIRPKDSAAMTGIVDTTNGVFPRFESGVFGGESLESVLGKEIAERVLASPKGSLAGEGLKVEAKGMRAFYDTIVPTALKKLLPKVGGGQMAAVSIGSNRLEVLDDPRGQGFIIYDRQTGTYYRGGASGSPWSDDPYRAKVYLSESSANKAIPDIEGGSVGLEQPGFDVTDAMREKVATTGLPMFSNRVAEGRQDEAGQVSRAGRADQQRAAQDVQPADTVPGDTRAPGGSYFVRTIVGSEVSRKLGADTILTPEQAAQATAYLYRSAVERFDGIVTDEAGKPLAVVGGFKGAISQASVYPATIVAEAVRVPGAARIWFSHNHPSGSSDLSRADLLINDTLVGALEGSGIEPMGLLAVAGKTFNFVSANGDESSGTIDAPTASVSVPVIERELAPDSASGVVVDSPRAAKSLATQFHKIGGDGIMLLNNRNAVIAWVPATDSMRGILRGTGGLNAIYRAISEGNASAAILVHDGSFDETGKFARTDIKVGQNIGAALKKLDVRVLDTIDVRYQSSAAERGEEPAAGPVFSNRVQQGSAPEQTEEAATEAPARTPRRGTEAVGDFDVRTMKDGTIVVYGDADAIRAQIPDDVKGRVTKDGIAFTNASAPRVKAALAGRKTAYSRGGEVVEKLPMKDGKYLGAPEKYNTPGKIVALRKQLRKLTIEGERGRYWYENSSKAILRMTGGNVQEARKFVALLAIYSPQARVDSNSTFALRAWAQYKAGQPISVKTGVQDKKATEAMADVDAFWSGEKTGNFFFNLLREIDPSTAGKQGATIDMWMMRAAEYDNDAPTATQYAFMENETNRIAQEMGWEPQQVQAAIWVAMKARMENKGVKEMTEATSEKKGWIRFERNAKGKKERVILNKQKHRDNWLKHAMEHVPTKEDTEQAKFDFADGVGRHIGQLSFEARPGRSTGVLDGIHSAPYAQQIEFQQAVQSAFYDENGADMLALQLGLLSEPSDIMRPGVWQGEVSPSTQKRVAMAPAGGDAGKSNVDPAQAKLLNVYASVAGLVARQEGVGWHRPFYAGTKRDSNGLDIDIGRALNPAETKDLEAAIGKWMADNGHKDWQNSFALISSPTGIRAVNFGIITNDVLQSEIVKVAEGVLPNFDYRVFASSGDMPTNDWKEFPNGQSYVQRIGAEGRSDVLEWARSVLAPRVQRVFEQFAEKYQWGDPGRIQFSNRAGDGSRGQGVGGAQDRTVQASDAAVQQEALSPLPGAPQVRGFTGPDPQLVAVAEKYARDNGITLRRQAEYAEVDPLRAKRIANAYEVMRHAPQDPKVKEAYENLIRQTVDQYKALADAGYKFWFIDLDKAENAEYASTPWNAMRDIRANKQMGVFPTAGGFGSGATELNVDDNPLLQDTGFRWPVGGLDGRTAPVLANDLFRAVHDAFGHGLEGAGFRAQGEENAWQAHVRLFTGSAVGAITSETRGQNSWLNYGPYGEKNRTAKVEDTVFADQKTGLMPEWTWTEGRVGDMPGITASKRAAKPELDADVVSIFRDLEGARGLALIRARERVDAHPMAETIRRVNDEFLDILERLDDAGLVKINCT